MSRHGMGLTLACGHAGCAGRVHFRAGAGRRRAVGRCDGCRGSFLLAAPATTLRPARVAPALEVTPCRPSPLSAALPSPSIRPAP